MHSIINTAIKKTKELGNNTYNLFLNKKEKTAIFEFIKNETQFT